jgi:hexosaminidase
MVRKFFAFAVVLCAALAAAAQDLEAARRSLMPVPASVKWGPGRLPVTPKLTASVTGKGDDRLGKYLSRVLRRLEGRTVIEFTREIAVDPSATISVRVAAPGNRTPKLGDDESYTLEADEKQVRIDAPTTVGAMRALETLLQIVETDGRGSYFPEVRIEDGPRFQWRGLMIDSARHFQPLEVLKRNLDGMAALKLNVLHWHLTDDQGFRAESKRLPELHRLGSDGDFYTQTEIREIIAYAADRGIRVVPEFDLPGHATSWVVSHPEIASAPGPYRTERQPGIFDPTLDPTNERTYGLLEIFFTEMAALFPDAYIHIGGDENEGKQWNANPKIQAFMRARGIKDNHELQTYFNKRVLGILKRNGKTMMGWDEIFQPNLPKDVVIHSWRGQKALAEAARSGYSGVLSNGYYIDLIHPASDHYVVDPIPADTTLTAEEQKRVLGGEATMWSEWVSPETIDSRIWPRTAAIAERFWSPRGVNEIADMYRRLETIGRNLEELGLTHRRNQPVMLRRLANRDDIGPLAALVSVIEPVKVYQRYQQRPQSMLAPLTGLIDAAQPDAEGARKFNAAVAGLLAGKDRDRNAGTVGRMLCEWSGIQDGLRELVEGSAALSEARQLPGDFNRLTEIASEALETLRAPGPLTIRRSTTWKEERLGELAAIAKPKAALEFVIVESVRKMVIAASEGSAFPQ